MSQQPVTVLDVGGTHVSACAVDPGSWHVTGPITRRELDSGAPAADILAVLADAGATLEPAGQQIYAVAMPDPFDYERGIGRFAGVAKFEALNGVDVRAGLLRLLPASAREIVFCNDADAFALGEWVRGAARGASACAGLTLGTGVGSGWVRDGRIAVPHNPPGGRAHLLRIHGAPLEQSMSRRAIRREYRIATGDAAADVRDIAARAGADEVAAREVLRHALTSLGAAVAPAIRAFGAEIVVLGGSMSASWPLFEPWFVEGAGGGVLPPLRVATHTDTAPLVGAAYHAMRAVSPSP